MIWKEGNIYMVDGELEEPVAGFRMKPGLVAAVDKIAEDQDSWQNPPIDQFQEEQIETDGDEDLRCPGDVGEEDCNCVNHTTLPDMVEITKEEYDLFRWMKFYFTQAAQKQRGFDIQLHHAKRMGDARYEIGRMLKRLEAHEDPEGDLKEKR